MKLNPNRSNTQACPSGTPAPVKVLISSIDHPASVALCQSQGECPAADHGLHTVLKGEYHCSKCGARDEQPLPTVADVLADPSVRYWVKDALCAALSRDCCDAANDAELLARVLRARAEKGGN